MPLAKQCTPPEVLLSGRATTRITVIPEAWNLRIRQAESAPAHVAINTPPPPARANDADSQATAATQAVAAKDHDSIVLNARYEFAYEVVGGCAPFRVSLRTHGDVDSVQPCLPRAGAPVVSRSRIYDGGAFKNRPPRRIRGTIEVVDCNNKRASCSVELII